MRKAEVIAAEIAKVKDEMERLAIRSKRLREEHNEAAVAEAQGSHPWIGKKVRREVPHGYRQKVRGQKGTVTVFDRRKHIGLRELYRAEPGHLFVLSDGGKTGYHFYTEEQIERHKMTHERPWELDQ